MSDDDDDRMKDLGAFIRERRNQVQLSLRKLSEAAGISNPYLSQIERGLRRPSAEILRQIANALSISSETLYIRAGILDEKPEGPDVVGTIERDPFLTAEQKSSLIGIYQSFRVSNGNAPDQVLDDVDEPATAEEPDQTAEIDTEESSPPVADASDDDVMIEGEGFSNGAGHASPAPDEDETRAALG